MHPFSIEEKIQIATLLDAFGVEYLELTSPLASPQSRRDCATIAKLGLHAKILTHTRCTLEDAKIAVDTGVDGADWGWCPRSIGGQKRPWRNLSTAPRLILRAKA